VPGQLRCVTGGMDGCVKFWSDLQASTRFQSLFIVIIIARRANINLLSLPYSFFFRVTALFSTMNTKKMR
jgi:hypothetical protein